MNRTQLHRSGVDTAPPHGPDDDHTPTPPTQPDAFKSIPGGLQRALLHGSPCRLRNLGRQGSNSRHRPKLQRDSLSVEPSTRTTSPSTTQREWYEHPNGEDIVVFQDHNFGHQRPGEPGYQPAHVHVRPYENTRNGQIPGCEERYFYDLE
ncbi:hypothetical protein J7F01_04795 [Streptomyces sp. ISL-22]|uniref:HNH/endonuclease VII fold putative polymorphic toxin n=1 Tax=unclassified Streptomyces TaxID=2593676 RepID=UPI001BEA1511|nr:hypothetical protein [Streptomyces sp. ISL-24]MBT2431531.1 hypothetical protein [Streptomyces sp. ISL-22]